MTSGLKLLIADDSVTIQKVVELTFLDEGMEVATAGDGHQAIARLEEFAPDIVIADVFMPGQTGYQVCETIKHHERFHNIPVMLLVGSFEPFDEAEARRVGADDVLTKPFQSIRQLVNRVGILLGGSSGEGDANTRKFSTLGLEASPRVDPETVATADLPDSVAPAAHSGEFAAASVDDGEPRELMSTAEIELTTADTQPLSESHAAAHFESMAFAGDNLMANPQSAPVVDMAEPFAAEVRTAVEEQAVWAERLTSDSEPAPADRGIETNWPIEMMEHTTEQPRTAASADEFDGLLDLGDLDATPVQPAYADSILELEDETISSPAPDDSQPLVVEAEAPVSTPAPAVSSAPSSYESEFDSGWSDRSTLTSAEKYAAIEQEADNREQIDVAAWEIVPSLVTVDETLDEPSAVEPPAQASMAPQSSMSSEDAGGPISQATPTAAESSGQSLSAEDIDAIARRVVEHMSENVVREIAWEVVPELAERLIKRRMEEQG